MMMQRFNPETFFRQPDTVAAVVAAAELFSLLKRSMDIPAAWTALVRRTTGDHVLLKPGGKLDAAGAEEVLFARITPVQLELAEAEVTTRDRFQCEAQVELTLCLMPERSELLSFAKTVLGSERVATVDTLKRQVRPAVRNALVEVAGDHDAEAIVDGDADEAVAAALENALTGPCFAAGLSLEGKPRFRFLSDTYRQVRRSEQEAARRQREHEAARQVQEALEKAQHEHLDHLAELLKKLKAEAADAPQAELGDLIHTFSERQRGELYQALFASEPSGPRTAWILIATSNELVFFDPVDLTAPKRRLNITSAGGPVRSVQSARNPEGELVILLGAATGVYELPPERVEPTRTFLVTDAPAVRGGFNSATWMGNRLVASHSELGLIEWSLEEPTAGRRRFEHQTSSAQSVRGVQGFDDCLYCSIDDRVVCWPAGGDHDTPERFFRTAGGRITALCPTPEGLFAGNDLGQVSHWPRKSESAPQLIHTGIGKPAESVVLTSTSGVRRLVYTDGSPYVYARVLGDSFTCRYESGGQAVRRVEVAGDLLVATNDLRDRLLCWKPGTPDRPYATIPVGALCGHSIQDVCLVPAVEPSSE